MPGTATADKVIKAFLKNKRLSIKQYKSNGINFTLYDSVMAIHTYDGMVLTFIRDSNTTRSTMKRLLRLAYGNEKLEMTFVANTDGIIIGLFIDGAPHYFPAPFEHIVSPREE